MRCVVLAFFVLLKPATAEAVTPVQKVLELLHDLQAKGKAEKQAEHVQFAAYQQFCDDTGDEKTRAIKDANDQIGMLNADVEMATTRANELADQIAILDGDVGTWTNETHRATEVRQQERGDYENTHADYAESIDALKRAIKVLQDQSPDVRQAQAASLLEVSNLQLVPQQAKTMLSAFLDLGSTMVDSAPEANAYEFHSSKIIDLLDKLLDKFVDEKATLEKQEMGTRNAHELLMKDLRGQIAQATQESEEKTETKAAKLEAKAEAEADVVSTTAVRDADTTFLTDLNALCLQKSVDFNDRQSLRAEEITAIQQAITLISSDAVAGAAEKHLPTLAQTRTGSSLEQLRSDARSVIMQRVAEHLRAQAEKFGSHLLAAIAARAEADPFAKVIKLIKDLIVRLQEEAGEEASHKSWCDEELGANSNTRTEKSQAVEGLHAQIDEQEASIAQLTEEIAKLSQDLADLRAAVAEAEKLRSEEHEHNAQKISDAQEAQLAVGQALTVLKDFYVKAAGATAMLQVQPEAPDIFDSPYQGMQGKSGGVIGLLEVIESDFSRLEAETTAAETGADTSHKGFMDEATLNMASMEKDVTLKNKQKTAGARSLVGLTTDLKQTQGELDAALVLYEKLKPSCINAAVSFDVRVGRRREEIQSLQEALRILNGQDIA